MFRDQEFSLKKGRKRGGEEGEEQRVANFRVLNRHPLNPPHIASNAAKWRPARFSPAGETVLLALCACVCALSTRWRNAKYRDGREGDRTRKGSRNGSVRY